MRLTQTTWEQLGFELAPSWGTDLVDRLAKDLGVGLARLFETLEEPDPLAVLKEQAFRMLRTLIENGDRDAFLKLTPILALLVESTTRRK